MPRAHRHFAPGLVWHITQRCHRRQFLLRFVRDRDLWRRWLVEARRRFGICVLNYTVTSNHVHLLVHDRGHAEIASSMQLLSGQVAQAYNRRKRRSGAFWEDRYHATAVDTDEHLHRCIVYIDLNMVRAGAVEHPRQWRHGGYRDLVDERQRYRVVDLPALLQLTGMRSATSLRAARDAWIREAIDRGATSREPKWTEPLAVGRERYVREVREAMGMNAVHRCVTQVSECGSWEVRDA